MQHQRGHSAPREEGKQIKHARYYDADGEATIPVIISLMHGYSGEMPHDPERVIKGKKACI